MSTFTRLLAAAALAIATAGPAAAQEAPGVPQQKPEVPAAALGAKTDAFLDQQKEGQSISSDVVGMTVTTQGGKKVGKIDNLLLDDQNNVIGAVMSVGGFLGMGAKKVALRWENIQLQRGDEPKAIIDMSEEQLADAPEFKTLADIRKEREDQSRRAQQRAPGVGTGIGGAPGGGGLPTTR